MKKNNMAGIFSYKITEYVAAFVGIFMLYLLFFFAGVKDNMNSARSFMIIEYAVLAGAAYYLKRKNLFTHKIAIEFIFIAGMILGVGNMLGTSIFDKGFDQGAISTSARGHFGYILNIVEGHLPQGNAEQYYQPPLFHFLSAIFVRLGMVLSKNNAEQSIQFAQIVNASVYCFMMIAFKNFICDIELSKQSQKYVALLVAAFPNYMLMGLRGNNDMLATFFMLLCIINTYRWYKNRDMKTIVCLALSFGLGMMSKISVGLMAVITGPVMIYCLVKDFRVKKYKDIVLQLAVFAVICFPIAMWYPIRNLILFDQPLNYVQRLDENIPIYRGNTEWYKRFIAFNPIRLIKNPFFQYPEGNNIFEYLLQTSIYSEYAYENNAVMGSIFMLVNIITVIASLVSMAVVVIKGKTIKKGFRFGFLALWIVLMASYIQFNISYPYLCTANFRYIGLTMITGAIYIGYAMQITENKNICRALKLVTLAFVVCSVAIYI